MELVTPHIGLIFWMTLSFALLIYILGKFAWKPVMKALKERENSINDALKAADKAREEMSQLAFSNEQLIKEAKEERDVLLRDARKIRDNVIDEAKIKAEEEAKRIIETAKENVHFEKMAAITDLKNQLAILSIEIAEKILKEELSKSEKQKELIDKLLNEINFN
ncbi:MAG TPA: F0F1 ATP synthase subunit B [Bacteroidales bacterium]|nr:F0F1 ATP synthase subunit B [Bacteroidales bacterium]HPS16669.1 F0F1 ATP synthase subunit B [Bacteroidales bacterium]